MQGVDRCAASSTSPAGRARWGRECPPPTRRAPVRQRNRCLRRACPDTRPRRDRRWRLLWAARHRPPRLCPRGVANKANAAALRRSHRYAFSNLANSSPASLITRSCQKDSNMLRNSRSASPRLDKHIFDGGEPSPKAAVSPSGADLLQQTVGGKEAQHAGRDLGHAGQDGFAQLVLKAMRLRVVVVGHKRHACASN